MGRVTCFFSLGTETDGAPLNPTSFSELFERYLHNEKTNKYLTIPGKLEAHEGKTLELYLTRNLDSDSWGRLLEVAKIFSVKLKITLAPGGHYPVCNKTSPEFQEVTHFALDDKVFIQKETFNFKSIFANTTIVESSEPDTR